MIRNHNIPLSKEVKEKIIELMKRNESLSEISKVETNYRLIKYLIEDIPFLEKYIKAMAKKFTENRLQISDTALFRSISHSKKLSVLRYYNEKFVDILQKITQEEKKKQRKKFISENHLQINIDNDIWRIYGMYGGSLRNETADFRTINSPSLRLEVKHYFCYKFKYSNKVNLSTFYAMKIAINVLLNIKPEIHYFADITETDVRELLLFLETKYKKNSGEKLSEYSIAKSINSLNNINSYLMGAFRNEKIRSPIPHVNPFENFIFHNLRKYTKTTESIPESIVYQMDIHSIELSNVNKLIYDIFTNTGLRLKEVYFLEEDCIEDSRYDNVYQLKYKPHKVLSSRKAKGLDECQRVMITRELANKIDNYISLTENKRAISGTKYIFLSDRPKCENIVMDSQPFIKSVKSLIVKHNICDDDGNLWKFSVRQLRKTLAVKLIEQGATTAELAYWLGHMCSDTADRYYAEVRKMKLAELNTQFFKEKFDILLSSEQMESYTEEERKLLYTDFRLEYRRVELGFCLHKSLDEVCPYRNSLYNCINCKNLCTGRKYLSYWQELFDQQKYIFNKLVESYTKSQIYDYTEYMEYKQEYKLLVSYQSIVSTIENGGVVDE
ncbi:MAG: site-specific integrase [Clostridia bacterium]